MRVPPPELLDKICFVIHKACVEIRWFLQDGRYQQAIDLADAVEHIPSYIPTWKDEYLPIIVDSFQRYQDKYDNKVFDYVGLLLKDSITYQTQYGRWRGGD